MRRRNASSTSSDGLMLVANTTSTWNGTSNFWPLWSVRKSMRFSSGTIHRFNSSRGEQAAGRSRRSPAGHHWPSAGSAPVEPGGRRVGRSSDRSVSSPPTITFGRRQRTQRRSSRVPVVHPSRTRRQRLVVDRVEQLDDVSVDVNRMRDGDRRHRAGGEALGNHSLAVSRRPVHEHRLPRRHRRSNLIDDTVAQDQVGDGVAHPRRRDPLCAI